MVSQPAVYLLAQAKAAKAAARRLAGLSTTVKNRALEGIAASLVARQDEILAANAQDVERARDAGLADAPLNRLRLTPEKIEGIARDVLTVASLPDPVGEVIDGRQLPNGLQVSRRRVPLGVLAAIFESRPNVTIDIAALCLKSGNACVLRGGSEAIRSNTVLARVAREAETEAGVPEGALQLIENTDRALVAQLLEMRDYIDLVVPRGGAELIRFVAENARMPVLTGGVGVCHTYVDRAADLEKAVAIAVNAKTRNWSICNAMDTLLIHASVVNEFLPQIALGWSEKGVEVRADERALAALKGKADGVTAVAATPEDFGQEFLAPVAAVRVVDSLDEALDHIDAYGTGHSDAIVTEDYAAARRFTDEVDTAVVYVNASTQFTDGAQFGLGAEIIDSTQKTIARGPVGLREITTYKWVVQGEGQIRP
ncbi:MAG TPA: glutamate-5-semialdehyde dehydrogenase [Dehalococcoidia bacterium]|nr:glutamate-5-semialdehyde dehydrogenase [Dehalococcoidia bacterium]